MAQIECKDVSVKYESQEVLKDISFSIEAGDYLCIVGENGSGKSTLVKTILGLENAKTGEVIFGDNLNKNEGTTNDSIIVKPENNTNQDANNKVESNISKLPVTGQAVASSLFVAFGTFLTGVGTFISRKKKDNK